MISVREDTATKARKRLKDHQVRSSEKPARGKTWSNMVVPKRKQQKIQLLNPVLKKDEQMDGNEKRYPQE